MTGDLFGTLEEERRAAILWKPEAPPCLDGIDEIELNFESTGLKWYNGDLPIAASLRTPNGKTWYLPWGHRGGGNLSEDVMFDWFQNEVRHKHITNANTRFDLLTGRAWGIDLEAQGNTFRDVQHHAALLDDYRRKFALDVLAERYLPHIKPVPRLDESRMVEYHAGEAAARSMHNVTLVGELKRVFEPLLREQDLMRVKALEDAVIPVVVEMEWNGVRLDVEKLQRWGVESEQEVSRCLVKIYEETGLRMNPNSSDDWARLLRHRKIEKVEKLTPTGKESFTDEVLKGIDDPMVRLAKRAGHIISLRSKYLLPYAKAVGSDGILRYSMHQLRSDDHGTVRGRFSSSDVNVQQVPRLTSQRMMFELSFDDASHDEEIYLIRQLYLPGQGKKWLCADAAQIEFRLFVHYSQSRRLLKVYEDDPHASFHKHVHAMIKPFVHVGYDKAKTYNFAKLYGSGVERSAGLLKINRVEAKKLVDVYDREFPEAKALLDKATNLAKKRGFVYTMLGRRARFPDKALAYRALNAVIQGSAADVMKYKLVELHEAREDTGFLMRYTVHDEVDGDTTGPECTAKVAEILNRQSFPVPISVPILWEVSSAKNWAEAK